jgi:hypothetical protein
MTDHRQLSIKDQLLRDADVFWFGEESGRFFAAFAADAALFHAAERNAQVAQQPAIHPHRAGVDLFSDTMCANEVLCPNARRQSMFDVLIEKTKQIILPLRDRKVKEVVSVL